MPGLYRVPQSDEPHRASNDRTCPNRFISRSIALDSAGSSAIFFYALVRGLSSWCAEPSGVGAMAHIKSSGRMGSINACVSKTHGVTPVTDDHSCGSGNAPRKGMCRKGRIIRTGDFPGRSAGSRAGFPHGPATGLQAALGAPRGAGRVPRCLGWSIGAVRRAGGAPVPGVPYAVPRLGSHPAPYRGPHLVQRLDPRLVPRLVPHPGAGNASGPASLRMRALTILRT